MIRVRKEDLRLGMFIESMEGSWFDHPFWKSQFLLEEMDDLRKLQGADIEVWIDESRSVAAAIEHLSAPIPAAPPQTAPAAGTPSAPAAVPAVVAPAPKPRPRATSANEFTAAESILADCKAAVDELFARLQGGDAGAIEDAAPIVGGIAESVERNPDALITLTRVRSLDEYTYMHSIAVSALMINLARHLQLPPDYVKRAGTAGLFMDLGKGLLPPGLLQKRGAYADTDWTDMRRHPQLGHDAVRASGDLSRIVADVCLHHHERYDGSGYPDGLKGGDISLFARMAAICDTYDAMASERPHRPARPPADVVAEMFRMKGKFEESLLTTFIKSIGIYPVGSLVRMESRTLGCVVAQRRDQLTRPVVRIFYSIPQGAHIPVEELDLAETPEPDKIVAREEPKRWNLPDWDKFALTILQGQKARRAA